MKKDQVELFKESLFKYDDYRTFLRDYFALQKEVKSSFTQRYFAAKAGFSSHTFCNFVINGKRNLSDKTLRKFIAALGLNSIKAKYFEQLVNFNQSMEQKDKEFYFDEMQKIKKKLKSVSLTTKQSEYFAKRYYAIVRELAVNSDWNGDYGQLSKMVVPEITTNEAKEAVEMMTDCGILKEQKGKYTFGADHINDVKVPTFLKKKSRREVFETATDALDAISPDSRFASYSTFSTDKEGYDEINKLYKEFRNQMNEIIMHSKNHESVYQVVFENFPVSKMKS